MPRCGLSSQTHGSASLSGHDYPMKQFILRASLTVVLVLGFIAAYILFLGPFI